MSGGWDGWFEIIHAKYVYHCCQSSLSLKMKLKGKGQENEQQECHKDKGRCSSTIHEGVVSESMSFLIKA